MKAIEFVTEIKKGQKDSNGFTKCWPGKHAEGTKKGKNGGQVRNCVPNESVAEGHADQQRKVFKKNGEPVGEVGIDRESSPGVGQYYMKHYASGNDLAGYDSYEEAVAELKHCMKQGVAETVPPQAGVVDPKIQFLQPTIQFAERHGYKVTINPNPNGKLFAKLVNKQIEHTVRIGFSRDRDPGTKLEAEITDDWNSQTWAWSARELAQDFKEFYRDALRNSPVRGQQGVAEGGNILDKQLKDIDPVDHGDDEGHFVKNQIHTMLRVLTHLENAIGDDEDLPEWVEMKISQAQGMIVGVMDYMISDKEQEVEHQTGQDALMKEEFDLIESIIEDLAASNGVDSEVIWEDLEILDDDELYVFATTSTIMETISESRGGNYEQMGYRKSDKDKFVLLDRTLDSVILTTNNLAEAKKEAIEWAEYDDIRTEVIQQDTGKRVFTVDGYAGAEKYLDESEAWQKANNRDRTDGMSRKAVKTYRREHPGSKLQTAVTTKPSKLKKGSKASKRRKSYCSRSKGQMKMHNISCAKTPDKAICKARRRWNC